jgi:arsenate reductase-like glutaredoxin family protein
MKENMLEVRKGELLFIYNTNKFTDKRAFGYVAALKTPRIKERDIAHDPLTMQQIAGLALAMDIEIRDLLDPDYSRDGAAKSDLEGVEDREDLLQYMQKNPDSIKTPIIVTSERTYFVKSGYEFVKEDMAVQGIVSDEANKQEKKEK